MYNSASCSDENEIAKENHKVKFRQLASEIAALGTKFEISIVPYRNFELLHFSKLNLDIQSKILQSLQVYFNIYSSTLAEGSLPSDAARIIWNALAELGFKPTSDVFSYIEDGNIIEIHDDSFVQIFRSINFFKFCSYSLEELYCHQMTDLYERDLQLESNLMGLVAKLYRGEIKATTMTGLKAHIIQEKKSESKLRVKALIKYIAPLYSRSSTYLIPIATLVIETADFSSESFKVHSENFAEI